MKELVKKIIEKNYNNLKTLENFVLLKFLSKNYVYPLLAEKVFYELNRREVEVPLCSIERYCIEEEDFPGLQKEMCRNLILSAENEDGLKLQKIWDVLKTIPEFEVNENLQNSFFDKAILDYEIIEIEIPLKWSSYIKINKKIREMKIRGLRRLFIE